jgi:hypothetical protein
MQSLSALVVVGLVGSVLGCMSGRHQEVREAHLEKLCTQPRYQYEAGYSRGLAREPLETSWADQSCHPEVRGWARGNFVSGFLSGIAAAQQVVDLTAGYATATRGDERTAHYAPVYAFAQTCRFSSDCGDDMNCRPREDGTRVCMGNGSPGEACWFGGDCLSGGCELQGDVKVCR